jgi:polysaccharide biosynthesis transport protein
MRQGSDVLRTLTRRFWLLALGLIWGGVLGGLASLMMAPTYQADVYLMVVTRSQDIENTAAFDYTQAYSKLPTVPAVVGDTVSTYGIAPTSEAIEGVVNVQVPLNTPVFQIIVTTQDPKKAATLANDLADEVSAFVTERLAPGTGYRTVVVAEATSPRNPVSPDYVLNVAVGCTLGLILATALALLWDDLWRKERKDLEPASDTDDHPRPGVDRSEVSVPVANGYKSGGTSHVAYPQDERSGGGTR